MKSTFLYHAEAVGASGRLTLPFTELIEIQASVALPLSGGYGASKSENFKHRDIFSFDRAESSVVGSYSAKDLAHGTVASVVIEGANILNVVTCDCITMRLTSKHDDAGGEASFIVQGSCFENLRIAGHRMDVALATDTFSELSTWEKLSAGYRNEKSRKEIQSLSMMDASGDALPESKGIFGATLARGLDKLPGGLTRSGHGIYVPHFGTVFLGELYITRGMRRLRMMHVELGCAIEGCVGIGTGAGNGTPWP